MLATVLSSLQPLYNESLTTTLKGLCCYYPHFTDEKMEI
jgi:hypothetical protein